MPGDFFPHETTNLTKQLHAGLLANSLSSTPLKKRLKALLDKNYRDKLLSLA